MLRNFSIARIALAAAVAGTLSLLLLGFAFQPAEVKIGGIGSRMAGHSVMVRARVDSAFHGENFAIFQLNDGTGKIKAVIFSPSREQKRLLRKNAFVQVRGKVQVYKGELEIVAGAVEQW